MKKIILILIVIILSSGCTFINDLEVKDIISKMITSKVETTNVYRLGYKYFLPKGMRIINHFGSNEVLSHNQNNYFMYVDYVSYYNKMKKDYEKKDNIYLSDTINYGDKFGYVEIKNTANDKYFVEIMYNYAKMEVIVDRNELKESIGYIMSILSSIEYQDIVLKSLMGEDALSSNEVTYDIFETAKTESDYLEIIEEYGEYKEDEENVDPDFIRR